MRLQELGHRPGHILDENQLAHSSLPRSPAMLLDAIKSSSPKTDHVRSCIYRGSGEAASIVVCGRNLTAPFALLFAGQPLGRTQAALLRSRRRERHRIASLARRCLTMEEAGLSKSTSAVRSVYGGRPPRPPACESCSRCSTRRLNDSRSIAAVPLRSMDGVRHDRYPALYHYAATLYLRVHAPAKPSVRVCGPKL